MRSIGRLSFATQFIYRHPNLSTVRLRTLAANSNNPHTISFPPPPPALNDDLPAWTDELWASPLDPGRRIFCNRSLNMASISAVGFDMDYTLAQYKPDTFETLAFYQTVEKLTKYFGYPKSLKDLTFDWRYMARGVIIDKARGNVIKVDRHKYVKLAYHGFQELSRHERLKTYNETGTRLEYDEPEFAMIDTLFSLAEAHLFMQLVELHDSQPHTLPPGKGYADIYRDVRGAVDLCHRDGSIKREVAKEPEKYIHPDPGLPTLLSMVRASGKKTFIATNSLWDYTTVVMNFLLGGKTGNDRDVEWLEYFDIVITGTGKPRFFTERKDLFAVDPHTGALYNTEGGSPMVPIGEEDLPTQMMGSSAPALPTSKVYQGGYSLDLHRMLDVKSGAEVLYVGDHIWSDVLRSKKTVGWRTMLVVPELESELEIAATCKGDAAELKMLRAQRDALDDQIQRLEWGLNHDKLLLDGMESDHSDMDESVLENLKEQRASLRLRHRALLKEHHSRFHQVWGQLLKTGYQNSRYAHQIERFACLYTSHVSNMTFYSPLKSYKGRLDTLAHEQEDEYP